MKIAKVVHLSSVHPPFDPRIFHKEARSLAEAGYDVTVVAPHLHNEQVGGVRVKAVPRSQSRIKRMLLTTWKVWRAGRSERAQVYHVHDAELLFAGLMLKGFKHRVIYDVHEDLPKALLNKYYLPRAFRGWIAWTVNLVEKALAREFDAIVAATDDIAENFKDCRKVVTVKNYPLLPGSMQCVNREPRRRKFRCAYVGGLSESRGISQIVNSLSELNDLEDIELILCGKFSPSAYERDVRQLPGFKRADCRGWIDPPAVANLLSDVDVGLVCIQPKAQYLTSLPTKLFE